MPVERTATKPSKTLDPIPNPHPGKEYLIEIECPEFTAMCPVTGQPDFATIYIKYVPGPSIVELKSLKLYIWSFRDEGHYHEDVTNRILNDLVQTLDPIYMRVFGKFGVRGGVYTNVTAEYAPNGRPLVVKPLGNE